MGCISIRAFSNLILYELYELCKEMTRDLACCNIIPDRIKPEDSSRAAC